MPDTLLHNLEVIIVRPRFPENIGMAARACANMGCSSLCLVSPERRNPDAEAKLATARGLPVLRNLRVCDTLSEAIAPHNLVYGTSARIGGWRKNICAPWQAAEKIAANINSGLKVALLFGSEDRGLENEEISSCAEIIHIRTFGASSLNLAQAILLCLYECAKAMQNAIRPAPGPKNEYVVNMRELGLLEAEMKEAFALLHCQQGKNPDYFFVQWHAMLCRAQLRRHEFDAMMGLCRQIKNRLG